MYGKYQMSIIDRMDNTVKRMYGFMLGFGIVVMFLATVGLIDKCMVSYADIQTITEVSYQNCVAHVSYTDYQQKTYNTLVPIECPHKEEYGRIIVLRYSPWDSSRVTVGHPWITCDDALVLYKFGLFIALVTLPYYVYMFFRDQRRGEVNESYV